MKALLNRITIGSEGSFGELIIPEFKFKCVTLERPDYNNDSILNNEKGNSCIPTGDYLCVLRPSNIVKRSFANYDFTKVEVENLDIIKSLRLYGLTYEVTKVGCGESVGTRDDILIHPANTIDELRGCIALGKSYGTIRGKSGIVQSRDAYLEFMTHMLSRNIPGFNLEVTEYGLPKEI